MNAQTSSDHSTFGISISVPTYNRSMLLSRTLRSLISLQTPSGLATEIVVIDNKCTDDTPAVVELAAHKSPIPIRRVVEMRQGLCFCRNRALEEARYEHVVFFDDDVEVAPEWLLGYREAVEKYSAECVVGPVFPEFEITIPSWLTPRVADSLTSSYSRKGDEILIVPPDLASEVPGCNFGVKRESALQVGGFRSELGRIGRKLLAGEDTEFGWRLGKNGKRIVYHPSCWIKHVITAEKLSKPYLRKRWYASGVTRRLLEEFYGKRLPVRRRVRYALGLLRLSASWVWASFTMPEAASFESELRLRDAFGYLFGRI